MLGLRIAAKYSRLVRPFVAPLLTNAGSFPFVIVICFLFLTHKRKDFNFIVQPPPQKTKKRREINKPTEKTTTNTQNQPPMMGKTPKKYSEKKNEHRHSKGTPRYMGLPSLSGLRLPVTVYPRFFVCSCLQLLCLSMLWAWAGCGLCLDGVGFGGCCGGWLGLLVAGLVVGGVGIGGEICVK